MFVAKQALSFVILLSLCCLSCNINDSNERNLITINSAQIYLINTTTDSLYNVTAGNSHSLYPKPIKYYIDLLILYLQ